MRVLDRRSLSRKMLPDGDDPGCALPFEESRAEVRDEAGLIAEGSRFERCWSRFRQDVEDRRKVHREPEIAERGTNGEAGAASEVAGESRSERHGARHERHAGIEAPDDSPLLIDCDERRIIRSTGSANGRREASNVSDRAEIVRVQ